MLKWLKRLVLFVLIAGACVVVAWRISSARLTEYARRTIERELGDALNQPVGLRELSIGFLPAEVEAAGFQVGEGGEVVHFDELKLRILPWSSLKQLRPVGEATIAGVFVDVTKLVTESDDTKEEREGGAGRIFPFRLRGLRLTDARVLVPAGDEPVDLSAANLVASGGVSPISGRLSLQADGDLTVRRGARELEARDLHLRGAEARDGWVVQRLEVAADGLELTGRLEGRDPPRHSVSAKLKLQRLQVIDASLDWLSGELETTAELTGSLVDPDGTATVRVHELAVARKQLGDLHAEVRRQGETLELASARLNGFGGEVEMHGLLMLSKRLPIQFAVDWHHLDVARLARLFADRVPVALSANGSMRASGALEPMSVSADATGRFSHGHVPPLEWAIDGHYEAGTGTAELRASQAQANTIRAGVTVSTSESLDGDVVLELGEVAALARLVGREEKLPFSGRFRASAMMKGSLDAPVIDGNLEAHELLAFGQPIGRMKGNFVADRRHARSDGLVVDFGDERIEASGTIGFDAEIANDWRVTVRDARIDRLAGLARNVAGVKIPVSGGRVSGHAYGRGPWSQVEATGQVEAQGFQIAEEPFDSLVVDVDASWPSWDFKAAMVHAPEERLDATMSGRGLGEIVNARVHSTAWSLERLRVGELAAVQGQVRLDATVRGKIESLDGQIKAAAQDLSWSGRKLGEVDVDGEATNGRWRFESALLEDTFHLAAGLDSKNGQFRLEATWSEAQLAPLLDDDSGVQITSSGSLLLAGGLDDPRALGGEARIPHLLVRSGTMQVEATEPIRISADKGRATIESFLLAGNGTSLSLTGNVTTTGELHVGGRGSGSLELLELIGEPVQSVEGDFELAVGADRHEGRGVALSGTVSVVDAALDVGLPIGVTETNGRFVLEGSRVRIDRLAGRIGGGTFSVDGGLDVEGGPDVGWKVVDVSGSLLPSLEQELSGHGTLRGPWNDLTVAGEVEILRMLYDRNIEPRDFVPSFKRRLAPPSTSTSPNVVRLDLHVYAPDDLHIDNNFARVEAMADLQVRGTTEHPKLRGRIDVLNGEAFFRDRTFDIITGVVDFRPQLDLVADLNITAETVVDTPDTSYGITVQISGTTDAPRVVLSSDDPGLTQTDIVSLITFGKTVAQLQQGSGGSSADALVGFLTGRVAKGVEGGAESLLRVDRVEIEPAFSSTSGAFEPQVKISKDFSDDFSTSIATTLGVDLQRALNLEYHLTDRTSLLGTWESESEGQAGAFGGGIKFRREFRSVPGFSLLGTMRK